MRKNPHGKILKWELKEQHLSTVPKSCSYSLKFAKWTSLVPQISSKYIFQYLIRNPAKKRKKKKKKDSQFQSRLCTLAKSF